MTIQEILTEADIAFVESGHKHSCPGWIQIELCPFCSSSSYHLGYSLAFKYWNCWRCGYHSVFSVFKELDVPRHLWKQIASDFPDVPDNRERTQLKEPASRGPLLRAHRRYLEDERGLDPEEMTKIWQAEGIGIAARLSWRIYIPILDQGKRVSWTTRAIGDVEQRYISASASEERKNHKHIVYGLDYVQQTALIVEGPFDVWKMGQGAVALFGTGYSTAQVRTLAKIPNRWICFDNSRPAQAQARKLAGELACFPGRTYVIQIDAEDPGSASARVVKNTRRHIGL